jgi:hypothetical protein
MSSSSEGLVLWRTRLGLFGLWAALWLLWRRGCYLGVPSVGHLWSELQFASLFVLVPGAVLLLGAPPARYVRGLLGMLLVGALVAESGASWQEQRFADRCMQTSGATVIEEFRFPNQIGGRMLFIRSPDGKESFQVND